MPFLTGIFSAIGGIISGAFSFLAGGSLLAKIALYGLSIAAQYAISALTKKKPAAQAAELDTQYGEKLARTVILGTCGTAGHHVYRNAYGKGNHIVQDVVILSHFRIDGVSRVRFDGQWKTLGGAEDPVRGFRIQGIDAEVWIKVHTGTLGQPADAGLIANSNPPGRWTVDHRGAGIAYAVVTSVLHRQHLPQPWTPFFEVRGAPLYDWRKDDTAGGSGAHRWADQDSWEFDADHNPVLMMYALERGIFAGAEKIVGKGVAASRLPIANWTTAANICSEIVNGGRRYKASCIASSGEGVTHDANMQPLLEACAGSFVDLVGEEYPIAGAIQSVVATFTDEDLVTGEAMRFSARRTRSELVNTVAGSFFDPESFYAATPFATRIDAAALAEDGERLAVSIPYRAVTDTACVDRLADIAIGAARYQANAEIVLRPKFIGLKPGDWVTWNSARYGQKTYQVLSKRLGALGPKTARNVYLSLQEVGAGIFDPTAYVTTLPAPGTQGGADLLGELQNFTAAGVILESSDGAKRPAIRATWTAIDDPTITGIEFEFGAIDATGQVPAETVSDIASFDQTQAILAKSVTSQVLFAVRHRLRSLPYRQFFWSAWSEVLTPDARLGRQDIYNGVIDLTALAGDVSNLQAWIGGSFRDLWNQVNGSLQARFDMDLANWEDRQSLRRELVSTADGITAAYTEAIEVATGPNSALVSAIEALQATVGYASGSAIFRMDVSYTPAAGFDVRAGLRVSADNGATFEAAALFLEANAAGSRIVMNANEIIMTDGTNYDTPFVYSAGVLALAVANIGLITAGVLKSADGKMVIDLDAGTFDLYAG